ncbi:hypothetical protein EVAR_65026_1 [Eumeta japonica]|uniref:Uncharacterized protein n=1 Tax=Eumeta variegata TaxID=151549 RepID=A0A4C1YR29_EUMVA|nr:hypothetical protein EVAR_65026_1 [Eumeta japonica]
MKAENKANGAMPAVMNSKSVSGQARLAVYNGGLIRTLMHTNENWMWQNKNENRINAVEMRPFRDMFELALYSDRIPARFTLRLVNSYGRVYTGTLRANSANEYVRAISVSIATPVFVIKSGLLSKIVTILLFVLNKGDQHWKIKQKDVEGPMMEPEGKYRKFIMKQRIPAVCGLVEIVLRCTLSINDFQGQMMEPKGSDNGAGSLEAPSSDTESQSWSKYI